MIVSDATIWNLTLEASIMLLEASFLTFTEQATVATLINYYCNTFIVQATEHDESKCLESKKKDENPVETFEFFPRIEKCKSLRPKERISRQKFELFAAAIKEAGGEDIK